jgi:hypothetical protein
LQQKFHCCNRARKDLLVSKRSISKAFSEFSGFSF